MLESVVYSMYMKNIPAAILEAQRMVFASLEIPLHQICVEGVTHGDWMTSIARESKNELIVFCDIDAFPLTRAAHDGAVASAKRQNIFGLAQVANHLRPLDIYAGPMYLSFSKDTYTKLGSPDLGASTNCDAAQRLTDCAKHKGIPLDLRWPFAALEPRWPLANRGVFGIGTFYGESEFFHLFESREQRHANLFCRVAHDVATQRPLNFASYLDAMHARNQPHDNSLRHIMGKLLMHHKG